MSLKARIKKIEKKLPKEDWSLTEFRYHGAEPTEEERDLALDYPGMTPPWKIMYVPYDFEQDLFYSSEITDRWIMTVDEKLGFYYDGEILFKLVKKYNKKKLYLPSSDKIEVFDPPILSISNAEFREFMATPAGRETREKLRMISPYSTEGDEGKVTRSSPHPDKRKG